MIDNGLQTLMYREQLPLRSRPRYALGQAAARRAAEVGLHRGRRPTATTWPRCSGAWDCQVRFIHLPDQYYFAKTYPEAVAGYFSSPALKTLEKDADVILADPLVRILSPQVAEAIQRKVQAGCGLVLIPVARWGGGEQFGYWPPSDPTGAWKVLFAATVKSSWRYVALHSVTSTDGL